MLISLDELRLGRMPGVEAEVGGYLVQAAIVCLEESNHASGVALAVDGDLQADPEVYWDPLPNPEQVRHSWDPDDATEQGACALAVLLIDKFTDYTIVERAAKRLGSRRGSGFDYWLDHKDSLQSQPSDLQLFGARLEVSGVRKGSRADVVARSKQKVNQTKQSDFLNIPAYVVVVEFSAPQSTVIRRSGDE